MRSLISACIFVLALAGCVSRNKSMDSQVVERSKRQPPAWIEWEPNKMHQEKETYSIVSLKGQILDLALGVKQTQLSAQAASRNALHDLLRKELLQRAESQSLQIQSIKQLDENIMASVEKLMGDEPHIKDIYYEKINASLNGDIKSDYFYTVYVLIQFDINKIPLVLKDLSKTLTKSPASDLVALGKIIRTQVRSH